MFNYSLLMFAERNGKKIALPTGTFYLISHYGAGLPLNRYGTGDFAVNQKFSLYDSASTDQQFRLVTVNGKLRIAMNGNTSLGLNVYRSGNCPCTLFTFPDNDDDTQVTIEECDGVSDCYCIYLTAYGKDVYTLTAPTNLTNTSRNVTWAKYTGYPEQIWKIKTSHSANTYSGHGRTLPARPNSTVTPFKWPCVTKTGYRGYDPSISHYGIDRDAHYKQSDGGNAPGDHNYPIYSCTVVKVYEKNADFGNSVWIASSNPNTSVITGGAYIRHLYMHLNSKPLVQVGDYVTTNTVLGYMGTTGDSTGVHLHLGVQARSTAYTSSDGYTTNGFFDPELILK